ncbi:MAG: hypothetical protein DI589_04230 [Shinella sp.]|nr:MAG: hypothetical protein DI589_04230 [Shinella sp.]
MAAFIAHVQKGIKSDLSIIIISYQYVSVYSRQRIYKNKYCLTIINFMRISLCLIERVAVETT